jgi:hypothetical protein
MILLKDFYSNIVLPLTLINLLFAIHLKVANFETELATIPDAQQIVHKSLSS